MYKSYEQNDKNLFTSRNDNIIVLDNVAKTG